MGTDENLQKHGYMKQIIMCIHVFILQKRNAWALDADHFWNKLYVQLSDLIVWQLVLLPSSIHKAMLT